MVFGFLPESAFGFAGILTLPPTFPCNAATSGALA